MKVSTKELLDHFNTHNFFNTTGAIFVGGTALSVYLEHRISEDLDFIFPQKLPCQKIITLMREFGGEKIKDSRASAFRINKGYDLDELYMKYVVNGVKVEFFHKDDPLSLSCLDTTCKKYNDGTISILPLYELSILKVMAFCERNVTRDLFDVKEILFHNVMKKEEFLSLCCQVYNTDEVGVLEKVSLKTPDKDDPLLYFSEIDPNQNNVTFENLQNDLIKTITLTIDKKLIAAKERLQLFIEMNN